MLEQPLKRPAIDSLDAINPQKDSCKKNQAGKKRKMAYDKHKSKINGLDLLDTAHNQQNDVLISDLSATTPKKPCLMEQLPDTELSPWQIVRFCILSIHHKNSLDSIDIDQKG